MVEGGNQGGQGPKDAGMNEVKNRWKIFRSPKVSAKDAQYNAAGPTAKDASELPTKNTAQSVQSEMGKLIDVQMKLNTVGANRDNLATIQSLLSGAGMKDKKSQIKALNDMGRSDLAAILDRFVK